MTTFDPRFRAPPGSAPNPGGGFTDTTPYASVNQLLGLLGNDPGFYRWYVDANNQATDTFLRNAASGVGDPALLRRLGLSAPGAIQTILDTRAGLRDGTTRAFVDPTGHVSMRTQNQPGWNDPLGDGWVRMGSAAADLPFDPVAAFLRQQGGNGGLNPTGPNGNMIPPVINPFPGGVQPEQRVFAPRSAPPVGAAGTSFGYTSTTWGPDGRPAQTQYTGTWGLRGPIMAGAGSRAATPVFGSKPNTRGAFPGFVNTQSKARYGS